MENRAVVVTMSVPPIPTVALGDLLTNSAVITPPANDIDLNNNSFSVTQTIVGSYDPNDIMETHGPQIEFDGFGTDEYLYYRIRFQNTGTASALTVRIEDVLDPQLDANTVQMMHASHDYGMTRTGSQLVWNFDNIDLPAASDDEPGSNGYVFFKVKPVPGFEVGDIIPNTAQIYFDTNPAIVTNTFNTEFVEFLSTADFNANSIQMYPNPASDILRIHSDGVDNLANITIFDIMGKQVLEQNNFASNSAPIDITQLAKGIYVVKIITESNLKQTKKLIIQ